MIDSKPAPTRSESIPQMSKNEYSLVQYLTVLYGEGGASFLAKRLMSIALGEIISRPLAQTQQAKPLSASDRMLICYGDSIRDKSSTPLNALRRFAATHLQQSVSTIHLLPFFPSSSDDGFAVVDYQSVRSDLGDWSDIYSLSEHFNLMFDLVINHCSRENLWFADYVSGKEPGCNYFHEMRSMAGLENVVRPRNSPLLTDVHTYQGVKKVWTTFSDDQIDLNFGNPEVLCEFVRLLFFYIAQGARFIRLDAIAFLWKETGTTSINLEQTHCVVRVMRALIDEMQTQTLLLTETNVPHKENVSYFGINDEAHLVYQFSLAPLLLYSYLFNNGEYLGKWAQQLTPPPAGCSFVNFIASHDGIGLRPLEGLVPAEDINRLTDKVHQRGGYATMRSGSNGEDTVYELNIALFSAFGGNATDISAYVAAHQLMMAFQGLPALYLNALVAGQNDHLGVESTGRTRSINRGHWNLDDLNQALADATSSQSVVFAELCRSLQLRGAQSAFAPSASQTVLDYSSKHLWLRRQSADQTILVIASFNAESIAVAAPSAYTECENAVDVITDETLALNQAICLAPYQVRWINVLKN